MRHRHEPRGWLRKYRTEIDGTLKKSLTESLPGSFYVLYFSNRPSK